MAKAGVVLIVDDNLIGRKILEGLLMDQGYQLAFADSGKTALEQAIALTPDLILLDVMMPDMDGFEVCRRLRADVRLAEVPVVIVTSLDDQESRLKGIEAGADDFISKPFNEAELIARVRAITRLNRYQHLLAERTRFEWVVEQADDGYILINQNDEILYANTTARMFLGLEKDSSLPVTEKFLVLAQRHYHCEPVNLWTEWPHNAEKETSRERYLVRPETSVSMSLWLQVAVLPQPASASSNLLIHLIDVTEQIASQRDMVTFHRVMNHKLRTPVSSMLVTLSLLADENIELPREERLDLAKMALEDTQRLNNDIQDILAYMETPGISETGMGVFGNRIPDLLNRMIVVHELKDVRVTIDEKLEDSFLTISEKAFETVVAELLQNSQKFHPSNSPIIEITMTYLDDMTVEFLFSDNGVSLAPEQLDNVWRPYYQAEKHFTGEVKGMGLGLSMVSNIMWQVGGSCRLYNRQPGPGVVVELKIPVKAE